MTRRVLSIVAVWLAVSQVTPAAVITVEPSGAADYPTIQEALGSASDGDTILIEPGTYTGPDNRDLDLSGKNIRVRSSGGRDVTIIDCEGTSRAFYVHSGEDTTAIVEGLTIINGRAYDGGAMSITGASLTVRDCAFRDCTLSDTWLGYGSVVYFEGEPGSPGARTLVLENCTVENNTARVGGTVYCLNGTLVVSGCELRSNSETTGSGLSGVVCEGSTCYVTDCLFTENTKECVWWEDTAGEILRSSFEYNERGLHSDAVVVLSNSSPLIHECVFRRNRNISIRLSNSSPEITQCEFIDNYGWYLAGGIEGTNSSPTVADCVFLNNLTSGSKRGHAIRLVGTNGTTPRITNCSSFGKIGESTDTTTGVFAFAGGCNAVVERSIMAFSRGSAVYCEDGTVPTITNCIAFSNAEGDSLCGDHHDNLLTEPLWCNAVNNDFDVCDNSPCLPANNPWGVVIGARGEGCGECITPVEEMTWGSIKAMYR